MTLENGVSGPHLVVDKLIKENDSAHNNPVTQQLQNVPACGSLISSASEADIAKQAERRNEATGDKAFLRTME